MSDGWPIQRAGYAVPSSTSEERSVRSGVKGSPLPPEAAKAKAMPPVILKNSVYPPSFRPTDEYTLEEKRIELATIAGPLRLFAAQGSRKVLPIGQPIRLSNATGYIKYVHVEPIFGFTGVVIFSAAEKGNRNTSIALKLPDDGAFRAILLPREELWGVAEVAMELKILELSV